MPAMVLLYAWTAKTCRHAVAQEHHSLQLQSLLHLLCQNCSHSLRQQYHKRVINKVEQQETCLAGDGCLHPCLSCQKSWPAAFSCHALLTCLVAHFK